MEDPIKLIAENPDLKVEPLSEVEIKNLIIALDFLCCHADIIKEEQLNEEPDDDCETYDMAQDEFDSIFIEADKLKKRLQQINMPCIATEIYEELKIRFSALGDDEMRRALRTVLNKYYK